MKNLYDISKGQLITIWVFAPIGWFFAFLGIDAGSTLSVFSIVFIPFFVIFYTIGWRNQRNNRSSADSIDK